MSISYILLSMLIGLLGLFYWKLKQKLNYWQRLGIPCEEPNIMLGNITGIETERTFTDVWLSYYKKFKGTGPFAGFYWFHNPSAFILDTKLAKHILIKDFNKFVDRGFYANEEDDPLSGHLFQLSGQKWRNMRNKLSPTFTSGKMKYMFPTVIKVAEEFINVFNGLIEKNAIIDVKDILSRFTLDVIGTCAFGIDCKSLSNPAAEFLKMSQRALVEKRFGRLGLLFFNSFQELARTLHMKMTPADIEKFFMGVVRDTVDYREKNHIKRNDFMDLLIELKNNKMLKSEDGKELKNITVEELAAQAFLFLVAGFETSSTTMGFALYELAQQEDIQQKAREEVNRVLDQHNNEFTYECMKEMQYIAQVLSETLRLYTVLPILNRKSLERYPIPGHPAYVIEKDMQVLIPAHAFHLDPEIYPNPEVFNPDNFSAEKVKQRDSIEYLPFGDGPRNCIGMRFGLMQSTIGIALLLKNFKFTVCKQTQIPMKYNKKNFLICSEGGIYLKAEKV